MTAKLTFHPLGNADCTRFDLADGRKMLVDYADMRNPDDSSDLRIDLPRGLKSDLRTAGRDYYDVVLITHLDDDHCGRADEFFWFEHATKYQGDGRIKIRELWVPAAAILEELRCIFFKHEQPSEIGQHLNPNSIYPANTPHFVELDGFAVGMDAGRLFFSPCYMELVDDKDKLEDLDESLDVLPDQETPEEVRTRLKPFPRVVW
jgi:hypothetical protein